jgi:hypothetical protein
MRHGTYLFGFLMALTFATASPARAQIETLIMPGKVVEAHAEYEEECANCHQRFERSKQRALCLDCHEEIAGDIDTKSGFHGKDRRASQATCANCHTDHEGRDADIVGLNPNSFDHELTDFPLLGKHANNQCSDCHQPEVRHRDTASDCFSCHKDDDPHGETMSDACGDCHTPNDWLEVEFDHDSTGYLLIGKHQEPACLDCHTDDTFTNTPTTCFGCHAEDDAHDGRSGNECGNCHSPLGWDDTSFDHNRDTRFLLDGKHSEQECGACHSEDPFADQLAMECISCHEEDDNHEGHFGRECESCHMSAGWPEVRFDHAVDTGHALEGAHADVECKACHVEPIFDVALATDCLSCHEDDDAHESTLGTTCTDCHNEMTWQDDVFFDHGLTRFPLLGKHEERECQDCHDSHVFRDAPEQCIECHRDNDPHGGRFGDRCALCHNPVAWDQAAFDHNVQTAFRLEGAHVRVECETCHRQPLTAQMRLGRYCADCHKSDDVHDGEFGPDCARCHTAESFSDVRSIR